MDNFFSLAETGKKRASRIAKTAKEKLSGEGVRLTLIIGVFICVFAYIVGLLAVDTVEYSFFPDQYFSNDSSVSELMQTLPFILALVLAVPFFEGYRRMSAAIVDGKDPDLRLMFGSFSSFGAFFKAYFVAIRSLVRPAVAVGLIAGGCVLVTKVFHDVLDMEPGALVMIATVLLTSAAAVGWLRITRFGGVRSYAIEVRGESIRSAYATAKQVKKIPHGVGSTVRLYVRYIPLILLSVLTVGVLFFIHTVPLMSLAVAYNSDDLISRK